MLCLLDDLGLPIESSGERERIEPNLRARLEPWAEASGEDDVGMATGATEVASSVGDTAAAASSSSAVGGRVGWERTSCA